MVDTSTLEGVLRASRMGEPPNQRRTERGPRLDAMVRGYLRNQQEGARVREEGLGSSAVDSGISRGAIPDTLSARIAGIGADMIADPLNMVPGLGLVVGGVGKAGRLNAIINKLNKSDDVRDFMTPRGLQYKERPNDPAEGLYRPGAESFDFDNVPQPASEYLFDLVETEKLAPLREFDRMAEPAGQKVFGPDNVQKLMDHLAGGGKLNDPTAVLFDPQYNWAYLGEGNHRLAAAQLLGLEKLPTTVWRNPGVKQRLIEDDFYGAERSLPPHMRTRMPPTDYNKVTPSVGRSLEIDPNQLLREYTPSSYQEYKAGRRQSGQLGGYYIPPTMHPYLFKYFRPE